MRKSNLFGHIIMHLDSEIRKMLEKDLYVDENSICDCVS